MKYNKLGKTDIELSAISFGCWEMGGPPWDSAGDEHNIKVIHQALELGIHTFDTAEGYGGGHSEELLGAALEGKRASCVIASKVRPQNTKPKDLRRSIEASLRRLRTDYLDIYYIHWPQNDLVLSEAMPEMLKLKEEGLIRTIGVSNFGLDLLKEAGQYAAIDIIQPEYSLLKRDLEQEVLPYCIENNIAIAGYSSLAKGILSGAFHFGKAVLKEDDFRHKERYFKPEHLAIAEELLELMKNMAESRDISISQVAISWLLQQEGVTTAIIGTQSIDHLIDNAKAADVILDQNELELLSNVSSKVLRQFDET